MNIEEARATINLIYGNPLNVIADCLRGFLVAKEGYELMACDFSNIEGRVLAWLANETWKIKAFEDFDKGVGPDLYKLSAHRIYGKPVSEISEFERLIGKVSELALGYQGGVGAFQSMAKVYLVKVPDVQADEIKKAWREVHPQTVQYWYDLESAAINAVLKPGTTFSAGATKFKVNGSFLLCCLPSSRVICYPYPEIKPVKTPWDAMKDALTYLGETSMTGKWERQVGYGGLLANNVTQATARDIFVEAMFRLEKVGFQIVMHTHDEIVCEEHTGRFSLNIDLMADKMRELPAWAKGLPVAVGKPNEPGWRGKRYRK